MKRLALVDMLIAEDGTRSPAVPSEATGMVTLHDFGQRALVKMALPDGTATAPGWLADITVDQDGQQTGIDAAPVNAATRAAIAAFLQARGIDTSNLDGSVTDRKKLISVLMRAIGRADLDDLATLLHGYDAG
jgi:hypothetical protein